MARKTYPVGPERQGLGHPDMAGWARGGQLAPVTSPWTCSEVQQEKPLWSFVVPAKNAD